MELSYLELAWNQYGWKVADCTRMSDGLINATYKVETEDKQTFLLQKINTTVFRDPKGLMNNLEKVVSHINSSTYPYQPLSIVATSTGAPYVQDYFGFWRALDFIENCKALTQTNSVEIALTTARAYADFIKALSDLPTEQIVATIPDFHDPGKRFEYLMIAAEKADQSRLSKAQSLLDHAMAFSMILSQHDKVIQNLPVRITHNDTKISNILFDTNYEKVIAIVDFDTVMPGYLIHDFGDLVRSICNTSTEDEADVTLVKFSKHLFQAITDGFLSGLKNVITVEEKKSLVLGARIIIYTQFIRFLTDYLNGDIYYQTSYPEQNLQRAKVHLKLLIDLQRKQEMLEEIVSLLDREI